MERDDSWETRLAMGNASQRPRVRINGRKPDFAREWPSAGAGSQYSHMCVAADRFYRPVYSVWHRGACN